jgi:hypothetical protein
MISNQVNQRNSGEQRSADTSKVLGGAWKKNKTQLKIKNLKYWSLKVENFTESSKGRGRSFENRSFKFSSKTGKQIDWSLCVLNYLTFYCFPNLT